MYDEKTRARALELVGQGMSPRMASREMGGSPGAGIIRKWSLGYVPSGKRGESCALTCDQKLDAILRVEAGEDYRDVAADVGCSATALIGWRSKWRAGGVDALRTRYDRVRP